MMDKDTALMLLESGEARAVVLQAIIIEHKGIAYISFDGESWDEAYSELAKSVMAGYGKEEI